MIDFYTRRDCPACDEARSTLQQVLEDRARSGDPTARVRYVDLADRPELEATLGPLLPVLVIGDRQLQLTTTYRSIARFLDGVLGRLA
jgi:glutaredoxin